MECITIILEKCKNICIGLREKLANELPELDMTCSNIQGNIFDDTECCVVLCLPNFYCCGEQCNFEINAEVDDSNDSGALTVTACISGILSFNSYYNAVYNDFDFNNISDIVNSFYIIISDWVKNRSKKTYTVSFSNPILKDIDCMISSVLSTIPGNVNLADIEQSDKYLPEHIMACDGVSIVDGIVDQIAVIFSAEVEVENDDLVETVLLFNGFSNAINKSDEIEDAILTHGNLDLVSLGENETIQDLPDGIYRRLMFCNYKLGVDVSKYAGYAECDAFENMLLSDWMTLGGYGQAIIVNGELNLDGDDDDVKFVE